MIASFMRTVGADRAVLAMLLNRGWSVASGLVTVLMIGHYLSAELQGYFFTLGSLIALQVLVELGLNQALVHVTSHEIAHLKWSTGGTLDGAAVAKARLRAILVFMLLWFGVGGLLLTLVLGPAGVVLLASGQGAAREASGVVWSLLVPIAAATLIIGGALAILEGCGKVAEVSLARLVQGICATAALWAGLAVGLGLFALVLQALVVLGVGAAWILTYHGRFFKDLWAHSPPRGFRFDWRTEMWPFQWRIAVSWASGFLIAQLFTPMLFASHGPVPAGQMGLALQVFGALNMLALAWVGAQVPTYGRMIALGQGCELDRLFWRTLLQSSLVLAALLALLLAGVWLLPAVGSALPERLPTWPLLGVLCVVSLANHMVFTEAALLRAHKQDPFMSLSVASGAVTAGLCLAWIPRYGPTGAVAAYAAATLTVGLVGGSVIFLRKRRTWWLAPGAAGWKAAE